MYSVKSLYQCKSVIQTKINPPHEAGQVCESPPSAGKRDSDKKLAKAGISK